MTAPPLDEGAARAVTTELKFDASVRFPPTEPRWLKSLGWDAPGPAYCEIPKTYTDYVDQEEWVVDAAIEHDRMVMSDPDSDWNAPHPSPLPPLSIPLLRLVLAAREVRDLAATEAVSRLRQFAVRERDSARADSKRAEQWEAQGDRDAADEGAGFDQVAAGWDACIEALDERGLEVGPLIKLDWPDREAEPSASPPPDPPPAKWSLRSQVHTVTGRLEGLVEAIAESQGRTPPDEVDLTTGVCAVRGTLAIEDGLEREDAIRRIAETLGYGRVGARVRELVESSLTAAGRRQVIITERGRVSLLTRTIEDYTQDERVEYLVAAMREAAGPSLWDREEAMSTASRYLGFRRRGPKIEAAFKSAINGAIRRGLLEADGPGIRLAKG